MMSKGSSVGLQLMTSRGRTWASRRGDSMLLATMRMLSLIIWQAALWDSTKVAEAAPRLRASSP